MYVLVNRSILCNFELEAEESFLLVSSVSCTSRPNKFKIYFTVNLAFVNYFDNWTDSIMSIINLNITDDEETSPLVLQDLTISTAEHTEKPTFLRDFFSQSKSKQ